MSDTKTAQIKALIGTSGAKLMSVEFKKVNGDMRVMVFNPKTAKGVKGDKASDSAKQAIATRKANHPNLISVCDNAQLAKGEPAYKCWRSINCDTVTKVKSGGEVLEYTV
jgi:hypothetical protein